MTFCSVLSANDMTEAPGHEADPSRLSQATGVARLVWQLAPTAVGTVISHYTTGPQQPSWSLSTDLFTSIARKHAEVRPKLDPTKKIDPVKVMQRVRKGIDFAKWVPEPKGGFAVDVEVPVRRSELEGVLAEPSALEDGERTVPAEWVIHHDVRASGVDMSPKVVLYLHGGAYILMNKESHRPLAIQVSKSLNCRVFSVSYRLAPESPFPGGLHDAVACYEYLTKDLDIPASNIIVGGDSAGGGLSMALMLYLRDSKGLQQIGGGVLLSPWVDSTSSLKSWESNAHLDYLTAGKPSNPLDPMRLYVGPASYPERLTHPYICSVAADLTELPPLLVQVGSAELLRDEGTLLAQRAATAGVSVTHELLDGGVHVAQAFGSAVGKAAMRGMSDWARKLDELNRGVAWDATPVDALLETAWIARQARTKGKQDEPIPIKEPVGTFRFDLVSREPPEVLLRDEASELLRKVVEENAEVQRKRGEAGPVASIYLATPSEKQGLLSRVRSVVHL